jgi:hypothetical protein
MSKIIKNFSEFESANEGFDVTSLLGNLGDVGADLVKSKAAEYLYGYLGIKPESLLGTIISKLVQTVDFKEYWDIITGKGDFPISKIAPKLADATIEVVTDKGVDGIASSFNSTLDKNGLIYRAIKEMITNQSRKAEFRENLISMYTSILTAGKGGLSSPKKSPFTFTPSEAKTLASDPALKQKAASGSGATDLVQSLFGGKASTGTTQG